VHSWRCGTEARELAEAMRIKPLQAMLRSGKSITDALYETDMDHRAVGL